MKKFLPLCFSALLAFAAVLLSVQPVRAFSVSAPEKVSQGRGFLVTISHDSAFSGKILWHKKEIPFYGKKNTPAQNAEHAYETKILLGMPIDAVKKQSLRIISDSLAGKELSRSITPLKVNWVTHKLSVAPKYVQPPKEILNKIQTDRQKTLKALAVISPEPKWKLPFVRPVKGTISGSFAARRIFNNEPRSPHLGTDMRGAIGTSILAMADGVVLLAEEQYFSGNAVWIDHGQGVISMYGHLSKFAVKQGDIIKQGQKIGEVGATGRVTGPHLHLGLYIQGVAVDAVPFFRTDPLECIGGPTKEEPRPQPKQNSKK